MLKKGNHRGCLFQLDKEENNNIDSDNKDSKNKDSDNKDNNNRTNELGRYPC